MSRSNGKGTKVLQTYGSRTWTSGGKKEEWKAYQKAVTDVLAMEGLG